MSDTLKHHGILGQKWGVRRTPEQLGHKTGSKSASSGTSKKQTAEKKINSTRKKTSRMTDEELSRRIQRLNMEEQYANLAAKAKERNTSTLRKLAGNALESLEKQSFDVAVKWAVDKIFGKKDPDKALRTEVEHLKLIDSREELLDKKRKRATSDVDVQKLFDTDVRDMDARTAQEVARYLTNAKIISSARESLKSKND